MGEKEDRATEEEVAPQGDFEINVEDLMADYEAQIAAKSREAAMARMETKAARRELESIKETLMGLQTSASRLPDARPVPRKKPASNARKR